MKFKARIAFTPLLLAFTACAPIDTDEDQPPVAQDQRRPGDYLHEHGQHEHEQHSHRHEQPREHQHAQHRDHQHRNSAAAPADSSGGAPRIWETDAPLRQGMRRIRAALHTLEAGRGDGLSSSEVGDFSAKIDKQVSFLINKCKLQPQADAALHTIIADLLGGAQSLKSDPTNQDALASMHTALQRYARQFDDSEWRSDRPVITQ